MRKRFDQKIFDLLMASPANNPKVTEKGDFIINMHCLFCGRKLKGSAHKESPRRFFCWNAGCSAYLLDGGESLVEYFDLTYDFEKENKQLPRKDMPRRYLVERALPNAAKYVDYEDSPNCRNQGVGAIMFDCGNGIKTGRFYTVPPDGGKTHSTSGVGKAFLYSKTNYDLNEPVYLVESPFCFLALWHMGLQAISAIGTGKDPAKVDDLSRFKKLILMPDNNPAGHGFLRRFSEHYPKAIPALLAPGKRDINDFLLANQPAERAGKVFLERMTEYETNAKLVLAETAKEYAQVYYRFHKKTPGVFFHKGSTWNANIKQKEEAEEISAQLLFRATWKVTAQIKNLTDPNRPKTTFNLTFKTRDNKEVSGYAGAKDLSAGRDFNMFLLNTVGCNFLGKAQELTAINSKITNSTAPEVTVPEQVGLDLSTNHYIFDSFAITPTGGVLKKNKNGVFKIGHNLYCQPPEIAALNAIEPADHGPSVARIYQLIHQAWGERGIAALSFYLGSLFVSTIKNRIKFYPIASLYGEPSSGKSMLITLLNQMLGFDTEGISTNTHSSKAATERYFGSRSNLPNTIVEIDPNEDSSSFKTGDMLPLFNNGAAAMKGMNTNDLQMRVISFLGTICMTGNQECIESEALEERTISVEFKKAFLTDETDLAYSEIMKIPLPQLARVGLLTLEKREFIENNWYSHFEEAAPQLNLVKNRRIREVHALLIAFNRVFCEAHNITQRFPLAGYFYDRALLKEATAKEGSYSPGYEFMEKIDLLTERDKQDCVAISQDQGRCYFALPLIEQKLRNSGVQLPQLKAIRKDLKRIPGYLKTGHPYLFKHADDPDGTQRRTTVFTLKDMPGGSGFIDQEETPNPMNT